MVVLYVDLVHMAGIRDYQKGQAFDSVRNTVGYITGTGSSRHPALLTIYRMALLTGIYSVLTLLVQHLPSQIK